MAAYLVELAATIGTMKATRMVVSAADATDAKDFCRSQFGGEGGDWANAVVTAIADVACSAANALVGWRFNIRVIAPDGSIVANDTLVSGDSTLDEIGALLVTQLELNALIANASYTANVLTVAAGAGGDDLGDHTLIATVYPPVIDDAGGVRENEDVDITGMFGTIVHEGSGTDALTVAFAADAYVRPTLYRRLQGGIQA